MTQLMPTPNYIFYLNTEVSKLASRHEFGKERFDKVDFQLAVQKCFNSLDKPTSWNAIEADQDPNVIHQQILSHLCLLQINALI